MDMTGQPEYAVAADALTKRYGSLEAVRGISFAISPRECYGFLGRNGAGKTTTMKMIYCRTARSSGSLHVLGMDGRHPEPSRFASARRRTTRPTKPPP
jgi:lipooligosaccharide transport system ATP-binding protein